MHIDHYSVEGNADISYFPFAIGKSVVNHTYAPLNLSYITL